MKRKEAFALQDHARKVKNRVAKIDALQAMIRSIRFRMKQQAREFRVHVSRPSRGVYGYDHGVEVTLGVDSVRRGLLPALRAELKRLRAEFQAMPTVELPKEEPKEGK